MPTSLLKRLLNKAAKDPDPNSPQTICGSLAPGERVDIGSLRAVNDGGDLVVKQLTPDGLLNWACSPDSELCISTLGDRPDEGVLFSRFGGAAWAFVAKVRPERCVVLHPVMFDVPLCRFGPGGDFVHDWQEEETARPRAENAEDAEISFITIPDDQAAALREAMAQSSHKKIEIRNPKTGALSK